MSARRWLVPLGWHAGVQAAELVAAGRALPVLGGGFAVSAFTLRPVAGEGPEVLDPAAAAARFPEGVAAFTRPRPAPFDRPRIVGVLNLTPDSFSGDGLAGARDAALARAREMVAAGADWVEVGGESVRPGAQAVPVEEELARILPVLEALSAEDIPFAVETRRAVVMRRALELGAAMLNDSSGFTFDPEAAPVAASSGAILVVTHSRGDPATMNIAPAYRDVVAEVLDELDARIRRLLDLGAREERVLADPGFCFAKKEPHDMELLRRLPALHGLGLPLYVGLSRKGLTRALEAVRPPAARLPASLAAAFHALACGARVLRVHDVAETRQVVELFTALCGEAPAPQRL